MEGQQILTPELAFQDSVNLDGASQYDLVEQAIELQEMEYAKDREQLVTLQKKLHSAKRDLLSYLPTKRFQKSSKDRPLRSKESVELQANRKNLLNSMAQIVHAHEKNKYISSKTIKLQNQNTLSMAAGDSKRRLFKNNQLR